MGFNPCYNTLIYILSMCYFGYSSGFPTKIPLFTMPKLRSSVVILEVFLNRKLLFFYSWQSVSWGLLRLSEIKEVFKSGLKQGLNNSCNPPADIYFCSIGEVLSITGMIDRSTTEISSRSLRQSSHTKHKILEHLTSCFKKSAVTLLGKSYLSS